MVGDFRSREGFWIGGRKTEGREDGEEEEVDGFGFTGGNLKWAWHGGHQLGVMDGTEAFGN